MASRAATFALLTGTCTAGLSSSWPRQTSLTPAGAMLLLVAATAAPAAAQCASSGPPCSADPCTVCATTPHGQTGRALNIPDYSNGCRTFYVRAPPASLP